MSSLHYLSAEVDVNQDDPKIDGHDPFRRKAGINGMLLRKLYHREENERTDVIYATSIESGDHFSITVNNI